MPLAYGGYRVTTNLWQNQELDNLSETKSIIELDKLL